MDAEKPISEKLDTILERLESNENEIQKALENKIEGLRQEFRNTSKEVNRLKAERDFAWKREGNKIQYTFNTETLENLEQFKFALQYEKVEYAKELVGAEIERIKLRNKHIKIADTSEGGWETVKNYVSRDLAEDSDDDRKISRAENKAVRKIKSRHARTTRNQPYPRTRSQSSATITQRMLVDTSDKRAYTQTGQPFRNRSHRGPCYMCGDLSHWRRDCPLLNTSSRTDSRYSQSTSTRN